MTDTLHLTPREVAQVEAALDEPTQIHPEDIRPGDTFRITYEVTCERVDRHGITSNLPERAAQPHHRERVLDVQIAVLSLVEAHHVRIAALEQ